MLSITWPLTFHNPIILLGTRELRSTVSLSTPTYRGQPPTSFLKMQVPTFPVNPTSLEVWLPPQLFFRGLLAPSYHLLYYHYPSFKELSQRSFKKSSKYLCQDMGSWVTCYCPQSNKSLLFRFIFYHCSNAIPLWFWFLLSRLVHLPDPAILLVCKLFPPSQRLYFNSDCAENWPWLLAWRQWGDPEEEKYLARFLA